MEFDAITKKFVPESDSIAFYKQILDSVPIIVYINTFIEPGNPHSLVNVWSNRFAKEFIGYTQEEIDQLGFSFFKEVIHPEDMEIIISNSVLDASVVQQSGIVYNILLRLKPKDHSDYVWTFGHGVQIETFDGGLPKTVMSSVVEITNQMHTENQLIACLKEINRHKNESHCQVLTQREKQLLPSIAKGLTDKEIAEKFYISVGTAKTHRNNIIKKLGLKNSASLAAFAATCGYN